MSDALADLVGDRGEFAERTWNRRPLVRRGVPPDLWEGVVSVRDLDRLLASRRADVHLLKDGAWVDRTRYMSEVQPGPMLSRTKVVDTHSVYREFGAGATIVLHGAHEWWPPLDRLCADLARSLTMAVQANVYVAPPGLAGHRHHDLHHIFALQLHGTKRWVVEGHPDQPGGGSPGAAAIDTELRPGDCLYVPRRFAHHVRTTAAYSTHVTFGVMAPTWSDVIGRIACGRLPQELLDQPLPPGFADAGAGRELLEHDASAALDATREMMGRWTAAELVEDTAERFGVMPDRTWDGYYESLQGSLALTPDSLVARRPDIQCQLIENLGLLQLTQASQTLEMPGWLMPAVEHALSVQAFRVAELYEHIDRASTEVLVRRLIREGVLELLGAEPGSAPDGAAASVMPDP